MACIAVFFNQCVLLHIEAKGELSSCAALCQQHINNKTMNNKTLLLECFKTPRRTRKLSRVWPWNLEVVAFCCHLPLHYKQNSFSVQIAKMYFHMLYQKPQVSTALAQPKISAVFFPSLTTVPNASSVTQDTRHKRISPGLHFLFFFEWGRTTFSTTSKAATIQKANADMANTQLPNVEGIQAGRLTADPTEREYNHPSPLAHSYRCDWDLQQACNHELIAYSRIYFSCCVSGSKIHGLSKETFRCSS